MEMEAAGRDIIPKRTHFGRRAAPEETPYILSQHYVIAVKILKYLTYPQVLLAIVSMGLFLTLYISNLPKNNATLITSSQYISMENSQDVELVALLEDYIKNYHSLSKDRYKIAQTQMIYQTETEKKQELTQDEEKPTRGKFRNKKKLKKEQEQEPEKMVSKEEMAFLSADKRHQQQLNLISVRYRAYLERKMQFFTSSIQTNDMQNITKTDQRIAELILYLDSLGRFQYRTVLEDIVNKKQLAVVPRNLENLMPHRILQMTPGSSLRAMTSNTVVKMTDQKTLSIDLPLQHENILTAMYNRQELRLNVLMAKDVLEKGDFSDDAKMNLGFAIGSYLKAMQQDPAYQEENVYANPEFKQRWRTVTDHKILSWLSDLTYTKAIEVYPKEKGIALLAK